MTIARNRLQATVRISLFAGRRASRGYETIVTEVFHFHYMFFFKHFVVYMPAGAQSKQGLFSIKIYCNQCHYHLPCID